MNGIYVLKLDIDAHMERPKLPHIMHKLWRAGFGVQWMSEKQSPSGTGWHIEMQLDPEPENTEVVAALQAILGSDPLREACNLYRARMIEEKGDVPEWMKERWNVLYRT